jgi:hypothetical protein
MSEISKQKDLAKMKERQVEEELDRLSKDLSEKVFNWTSIIKIYSIHYLLSLGEKLPL